MTSYKAALPQGLPFLNGVYVAVNAVPDAYLLVDGPYCVSTKAEMQYCHDLCCDLLSPTTLSRVMPTLTGWHTEEVASLLLERSSRVERQAAGLCAQPEVRVLLLTAIDFVQLVESPLEPMAESLTRSSGKPVMYLPSGSLSGNWLDGYAALCATLARHMPLAPTPRKPRSVAIVGHLMDRLEPDQRGNIHELRRMMAAVGINVTAVWLSGADVSELAAVAQAECIVSLPYAREAASILADRLSIPCLECDQPVGLTLTAQLLTRVTDHFGVGERGRQVIDEESRHAIQDTERQFYRFLAGRVAVIALSDPNLAAATASLCQDIGVSATVSLPGQERPGSPDIVFESSGFEESLAPNRIPFGYPNYLDHPVVERPILGYRGFRTIVERMAAAALRHDAATAGPSAGITESGR